MASDQDKSRSSSSSQPSSSSKLAGLIHTTITSNVHSDKDPNPVVDDVRMKIRNVKPLHGIACTKYVSARPLWVIKEGDLQHTQVSPFVRVVYKKALKPDNHDAGIITLPSEDAARKDPAYDIPRMLIEHFLDSRFATDEIVLNLQTGDAYYSSRYPQVSDYSALRAVANWKVIDAKQLHADKGVARRPPTPPIPAELIPAGHEQDDIYLQFVPQVVTQAQAIRSQHDPNDCLNELRLFDIVTTATTMVDWYRDRKDECTRLMNEHRDMLDTLSQTPLPPEHQQELADKIEHMSYLVEIFGIFIAVYDSLHSFLATQDPQEVAKFLKLMKKEQKDEWKEQHPLNLAEDRQAHVDINHQLKDLNRSMAAAVEEGRRLAAAAVPVDVTQPPPPLPHPATNWTTFFGVGFYLCANSRQ